MFCSKCGAQMNDDVRFCPSCGTAVENAAPAQKATEVPAPVAEQTFDVAPVAEVSAEPAPVKKKGKGLKAFVLVAVSLLVVAALVLGWFLIFAKDKGAPEDYLVRVEENALKQMAGSFAQTFKKSSSIKGYGVKGEIGFKINESILSMLAGQGDVDLSFLSDISLKMTTDGMIGGAEEINMDLMIGGEKLATVEAIMDPETQGVYLRVPDFNDEYLRISLSDLYEQAYGSEDMGQAMSSYVSTIFGGAGYSFLEDVDISAEELEALLVKYLTLALDSVESVSMDDYDLKVGGVTQSVTRLTVTVTYGDLQNMARAILTELKDDEAAKDLIQSVVDSFMDIYLEYESLYGGDSSAPAFDLDEILDELLQEIPEDGGEDADETVFVLYDYVDDDDAIVGRRLEIDGEDLFYASAEDGDEMAFTLEIAGQTFLLGKGTLDDGAFTGTITLYDDTDSEIFNIDVENFLAKEDGSVKGTVRIVLPSELMGASGSSSAGMLSQVALVLKINEFSTDKVDVELSVEMGKTSFMSLSVSSERTESNPVTVPKDALDLTDERDLNNWLSDLDLEEVLERLEDVGLGDFVDEFQGEFA